VNFDDPSGLILGIPGTPSWNTLGAYLVGAVDGATFGLTSGFRDALGLNGGLDKSSSDDQISRAGARFAANLDVGIATGAQLHLRPRWQPTTSGSGATTNLQYDGGHQIAGLDHFAARYYDPGIARWTQQDPHQPNHQPHGGKPVQLHGRRSRQRP
jgi:RHS repeat-associated protein